MVILPRKKFLGKIKKRKWYRRRRRGYTIGFHSIWGHHFFTDHSHLYQGENIFYPLIALKEYAANHGVTMGMVHEFPLKKMDAFVFHEVPKKNKNRYFRYARKHKKPMFLYNYEPAVVYNPSHNLRKHKSFRKIFTQHDQYIDGNRYIKINPFCIDVTPPIKNAVKKNLCTLITSNKFSTHPQELYSKRVEIIEWLEKNHPECFEFYGLNWDPMLHPCYKGMVENKIETLSHYRFAICYENAIDVPGYITEKIFDCFRAGCVPIYLGANNIFDYIPADCFIDRLSFSSNEELFSFISDMPEETYFGYLTAIDNYLNSDLAMQFSVNQFVRTMFEGLMAANHKS